MGTRLLEFMTANFMYGPGGKLLAIYFCVMSDIDGQRRVKQDLLNHVGVFVLATLIQ